ncbi:hypothetical protein Ae356Ps1_3941c [Pseudonocardia sp. Ae356_Ps1]|nr:hypothetical protein Ae150APs1_2341c [Pseudonocardia sp. Ae150A_Ps1]OLL94044.1 hypothetical protein Ae356Ps1_3941c [Pseudonocardia sp. Ae356_Ps1]
MRLRDVGSFGVRPLLWWCRVAVSRAGQGFAIANDY